MSDFAYNMKIEVLEKQRLLEALNEVLKDHKLLSALKDQKLLEALNNPKLLEALKDPTLAIYAVEPDGVGQIWHPYPKEKPKEAGEYLVAQTSGDTIIYYVATFGTSHWVEGSQKSSKAKKHHRYWYKYDSQWGDYTCCNVIAWMPIQKNEKKKEN